MSAAKTPSVPALERALAILELVANSRAGLTFSQIARSLDVPKSSVHCLLVTFERKDYLRRAEGTGRYTCGSKLARIAHMALDGAALRENAAPLLQALVEKTRLTAHMAILEDNQAVLIARHALLGEHTVATWLGKRIDVHCTSLGKCLIAYLPEEEVARLVHERGLLRHNENTITSLPRLKQELAKTRQRGYAIDDEEEEIGIRCIGVPLLDGNGQVCAAISLSGNTDQIRAENCAELDEQLRRTAAMISDRHSPRPVAAQAS